MRRVLLRSNVVSADHLYLGTISRARVYVQRAPLWKFALQHCVSIVCLMRFIFAEMCDTSETTHLLEVACRGLHCVCEDVEQAAAAGAGEGDIAAVAWAPRFAPGEERLAIARGTSVQLFALRTVAAEEPLEGSDAGQGTELEVLPVRASVHAFCS